MPREEKSYFHAGDSGRRQAVCRGGSRHQTTPIPADSENGEAFWQHTHEVAVRGLQQGGESFEGRRWKKLHLLSLRLIAEEAAGFSHSDKGSILAGPPHPRARSVFDGSRSEAEILQAVPSEDPSRKASDFRDVGLPADSAHRWALDSNLVPHVFVQQFRWLSLPNLRKKELICTYPPCQNLRRNVQR